jgi:hypothetical protein
MQLLVVYGCEVDASVQVVPAPRRTGRPVQALIWTQSYYNVSTRLAWQLHPPGKFLAPI